MANILLSVRLSPRLAAILDRATQHLDCSPSELVEMLLRGSRAYQEELLRIPVQGRFTEKRNLRLRPETIQELRRLTGYKEDPFGEPVYDIERSTYIRSTLAYFFSNSQAFQSVVPDGPRAEEWARILKEEVQTLRTRQTARAARPGDPRIGVLILVLPFLVLLIIGIVDLFKGSAEPPRDTRPPDLPNGPEEGLGEDTGNESNPPSREET